MRIGEGTYEESGHYTDELKARVGGRFFQYASQIREIRELLKSLKEKTEELQQFILAEEEENENNEAVNAFNEKMQYMMGATIAHLKMYQFDQWKNLFDDEGPEKP